MIEQIKKHLSQTAIIKIADLLSLYETGNDLRYDKNWTAYCKRDEQNNLNQAVYCPKDDNNDAIVNYFEKDIKYATIVSERDTPKINFWGNFENEFTEIFDSTRGIQIIRDNRIRFQFMPNTKYEIFEKYTDFEYTIYKYICGNQEKVINDLNKLFQIARYNSELPSDRTQQLNLCKNRNEPFFLIQGPPGTGKTSFLSDLIVEVINNNIFSPGEILCLTHTNRAAEEIKIKLKEYINDGRLNENIICDDKNDNDINKKIWVSNYYKTIIGNLRKFILVDEASQISLPFLLYALRHAANDAIFRFFGDQKQLAPVNTYVRDIEKVPNFQIAKNRYFTGFNNDIANFLQIGIENGYDLERVFDHEHLRLLEMQIMLSPFRQSIFSILTAINNNQFPEINIENIRTRVMTFRENFRQEEDLHNVTHNLFYNDISGHISKFNLIASNLRDYQKLNENKKQNFLQYISHNYELAKNNINRIIDEFSNFLRRIFRFVSNIFTQNDEMKNFSKSPDLFKLKTRDELHGLFREFFDNNIINNTINGLNIQPDTIFNIIYPFLHNKIIVIKHNFQQERNRNVNLFEVIISCLFMYLWHKEEYRIEKKFGIITPYRIQEILITNLFRRAFPDIANELGDTGNWCATPERFQGRDLSRALYSCVNSSLEQYKQINTMFSENKLNVATSRASSQQIILVNSNLLNINSYNDLLNYAVQQNNEINRDILKEYPIKYIKKILEYGENVQNICEINF